MSRIRPGLYCIPLLALVGCAGPGAPPPSATNIPWDPKYLTVLRQGEADRWAKDVARRNRIEVYMNALCSSDGWWAQMDAQWGKDQAALWSDVLWKFEPIPNTPANTGGSSLGIDISSIVGSLLGSTIKGALMASPPRKAALPPGLPPC